MEKFENFITIRLLMQGKEVGSIIGKKGDNIKLIREQSGARITISDGSTPERIVTINGVVENVNKAFSMICKKFEDDLKQTCNANSIPPITLRLIVPASQCGSIIGKGGSKIKEIREQTGASIQVASEMLPGSTERAVTVSGKLDSIVECFKQVSAIMLESPPKGDTLSYKPRQIANSAAAAVNAPIIFAHGQAYQVQGQYAIPLPPHEVAKLIQIGALSQVQPGPMPTAYYYPEDETQLLHNQTPPPQQQTNVAAVAAAAAAGAPPRNIHNNIHNVQTHEMNIPNDLIGCIIGRGGQKISEIRLVSGANIKIADLEDGNPDRHVSITGTPDQIQLAQFLINASTNTFTSITTDNYLNNNNNSTYHFTSNYLAPNLNNSIQQQQPLATAYSPAMTAITTPITLSTNANKFVISNQLLTESAMLNDKDQEMINSQLLIDNKIDNLATNKDANNKNIDYSNNTNYAANLTIQTNTENELPITSTTTSSNTANSDLYNKSLLVNLQQNEIKNNLNFHPLFQPLMLYQQKPQSNQFGIQVQEQASVSSSIAALSNQQQQQQKQQQPQQHYESKLQLQNINNQYQYRLNDDLLAKSSYQLKRNQIYFKPY